MGYLESGRLLFSEEMSSLASRFREVEITRDTGDGLPPSLPSTWLRPKSAGTVVRFVDSRFEEQQSAADINRLFGEVKDVQYRALSLRAIFLAMARKSDEA